MTEQGGPTPHEKRRTPAEGGSVLKKEREPKDDGRYIIFYAFEDEGEEDKGEDSGEGSTS